MRLSGGTVPAGEAVRISYAAANRDPRAFEDGDRLDVTRAPDASHLAFGHGAHHCVGARLARMELRVALGALLTRLPGLSLVTDQVRWKRGMATRGPPALPVAWEQRRRPPASPSRLGVPPVRAARPGSGG